MCEERGADAGTATPVEMIVLLLFGLAAMGLLLALVGIGQYAARHVFWNPKVIVGMVNGVGTGAGAALFAGALLGVIVGTVIVAQTLYSSTKDHLSEFATLRAMGYANPGSIAAA